MSIIENGTIVTIYHDPLTRKNEEGKAMVLDLIMQSDYGIGLYHVHLLKDDPETVVQRWIAGDAS
jgi:meiotically up-regulated gene 157 (Mug157) protein